MAEIIGEIKPDWVVVKYDRDETAEKNYPYDLCRSLISPDLVIGASKDTKWVKDGWCEILVRVYMDSPKVKLKISTHLNDLVAYKITDLEKYADKEWHEFPSYEEMVKQAAKDYPDWVIYTEQKNDWDLNQEWSNTNTGYELVFPILRDVEKILFRN